MDYDLLKKSRMKALDALSSGIDDETGQSLRNVSPEMASQMDVAELDPEKVKAFQQGFMGQPAPQPPQPVDKKKYIGGKRV
jgi:hypothetical protein